jgi:hypothetical protein
MWKLADSPIKSIISLEPKIESEEGTFGTTTSVGGFRATVCFSVSDPIRLVYTDPDGNELKRPEHTDTALKIAEFVHNNKEALLKIGVGIAKIFIGKDIATWGTSGGAAIIVSSGGVATIGGVAVAGASIVTGGAFIGSGVADIRDGIVMMSQGNSSSSGNREYREKTRGANQSDKKMVDSVAKEAKIDRHEFGDFVEQTKLNEGRGPSDNYTYQELRKLAEAFKELQ